MLTPQAKSPNPEFRAFSAACSRPPRRNAPSQTEVGPRWCLGLNKNALEKPKFACYFFQP